MSSRGSTNVLTRSTAILAACFFCDQPAAVGDCRLEPQSGFDPGTPGYGSDFDPGRSGAKSAGKPAGTAQAAGRRAFGAAGAAIEVTFKGRVTGPSTL